MFPDFDHQLVGKKYTLNKLEERGQTQCLQFTLRTRIWERGMRGGKSGGENDKALGTKSISIESKNSGLKGIREFLVLF